MKEDEKKAVQLALMAVLMHAKIARFGMPLHGGEAAQDVRELADAMIKEVKL